MEKNRGYKILTGKDYVKYERGLLLQKVLIVINVLFLSANVALVVFNFNFQETRAQEIVPVVTEVPVVTPTEKPEPSDVPSEEDNLISIEEYTEDLELVKTQVEELASKVDMLTGLTITQNDVIKNMSTDIIFDSTNLTILSNASVDQFNLILQGTKLEGMGAIFKEIELQFGVNAIGLISIIRQESGIGASPVASEKNNLAGIYDSSAGDWMYFDSVEDSIYYLARLVKENYLTETGKYFNGYGILDMNIRYCLTPEGDIDWNWSTKIDSIGENYEEQLNGEG